jgi:hypothetical protein
MVSWLGTRRRGTMLTALRSREQRTKKGAELRFIDLDSIGRIPCLRQNENNSDPLCDPSKTEKFYRFEEQFPMCKLRLFYSLLVPLIIVLAFATRSGSPLVPAFIAKYGGDTLWAWMVFVVIRLISPHWAIWKSAALALTIAYCCEISQLYHAPWIDAIRSYRLGVVLLGDCFVWSDLVCYTVGILVGAFAEWGVGELKLGRS